MRNFNYLMMLTALVGFAAFTACERNANPETSQSSAVKFTGGVNDMSKTRAAGTAWAAGDQIGVFMVRNATPTVVDGAANRQYLTVTDPEAEPALILGDFNPVGAINTIFYPMDGNDVNFIAYYPYNPDITTLGDYTVTIPADQNPTDPTDPTTEVQPTFDLLYAVANSGEGDPVNNYNKGTKTPVAFQFQHKLSKVVFNVLTPTVASGVTVTEFEEMVVTITNSLTSTTFNLANGEFGEMGTAGPTITRKLTDVPTGSSAAYDAIVLPFDYADLQTPISLVVNFTIPQRNTDATEDNPAAGTYRLTLTTPTFVSGYEYVYNVTVTRNAVEIQNSTINPWTPSPNNPTPVTAE